MVAYSAINDAELAVNKPLTSSLMFRLRDNPESLFETHKSLAKAWVNFNGTGTLAIRDSHNVTSVTDNGTGDYTVNFTTAFANTDYAYSANTMQGGSGQYLVGLCGASTSTGAHFSKTTSAMQLKHIAGGNGAILDAFDATAIFYGVQ